MKKYLRIAHRVLGFWCAAIFAVVCATGGVYAFREEIARIVEPERYYVDAQVVATQRRLPIDDVIAQVEAETNARAETILIPSDQRRTYNFLLKELSGRRGRALLCDVDPFTGEITGRGPNRSYPLVNKAMRRWHTRLNLPKEIGRPLVDFATYFSIFLIVSGVALALGAKHGTLATPLRIERGDSGQDVANEEINVETVATSGSATVALEEILRRDFERSRKTGDVRLRLPVDQNEQAIRIERKSGGCWACSAPDVAYWDGVKGTLIAEKKLRDATFDEQTKVLLREIHFGAAFGLGTKIIFGVASLAGAALAFFGIAIWALRDVAPKKKAQTANGADVANEKEGLQTA